MSKQVKEDDVQNAIIEALVLCGLTVQCTTVRGFRPHKGAGYGTTPGIPDLLVYHESMGWVALPLEVKGPKTRLSEAQKGLYERNLIQVVRSVEDACAAVLAWLYQNVKYDAHATAKLASICGAGHYLAWADGQRKRLEKTKENSK